MSDSTGLQKQRRLLYTHLATSSHAHRHPSTVLCLHIPRTTLEDPSRRKDPIGLHMQCTMLAYPKVAGNNAPKLRLTALHSRLPYKSLLEHQHSRSWRV